MTDISRGKKKKRGTSTPVFAPDGVVIEHEARSAVAPSEAMKPPPIDEAPTEPSKRDKRRAKEAKKKAEEDSKQAMLKETRKSERKSQPKGDTTAQQDEKLRKHDDFVTPKRKGKQRAPPPPSDLLTEDNVVKAVGAVNQAREKLVDKWGDNWFSALSRLTRHA